MFSSSEDKALKIWDMARYAHADAMYLVFLRKSRANETGFLPFLFFFV
jgi:hypothetical protein